MLVMEFMRNFIVSNPVVVSIGEGLGGGPTEFHSTIHSLYSHQSLDLYCIVVSFAARPTIAISFFKVQIDSTSTPPTASLTVATLQLRVGHLPEPRPTIVTTLKLVSSPQWKVISLPATYVHGSQLTHSGGCG